MLTSMNVDLDVSVDELFAPMGTSITTLSTKLLGMAGNAAFSLPSILISVIICVVSTLFMLFDWDRIMDFIYLQLSRRNSDLTHKIVHQSGKTIKQYILSYGLILTITFTELSIGFLLIGFDNAFLLAALISVFDILPVLGCGGVLIPWMIISFIIGNTANGVGLLLLYMVVTIVRNATEPKIVGKQVGLHPLATLMSMVVVSSLMGGVGLFGLPIALAVITKMNRDGVIHLFKTVPEKTSFVGTALISAVAPLTSFSVPAPESVPNFSYAAAIASVAPESIATGDSSPSEFRAEVAFRSG